MTNVSAAFIGIGSEAASPVPSFEQTKSTSGTSRLPSGPLARMASSIALQNSVFIASDVLEREHRQVDDDDDRLAERRRAADLLAGFEDDLEPFRRRQLPFQFVLPLAEQAQAVLDDDDGPVDDQAEVDRAEAQEVAAD